MRNWRYRFIYIAALFTGLFLAPPASATTFSYDEAGRLVATTYDDGSQIIYDYDAAGNRTQVQRSATGASS